MSKVLEFLKNKGIRHLPLALFVYIALLQTFGSRWVVSSLKIPGIVSKGTALLLYLPLAALVLWKLICDVQKKRITAFNVCYYGFAAYYFCLTVVRYFTQAEIKENLYYTIILLGSVALFDLIRSKRIRADKKSVSDDILYFSLFMLAYRWLYVLLLQDKIHYSPINEIAICGCLVLLLPVVAKKLAEAKKGSLELWLCSISVFGIAAVLLTLKSRVGFWVLVLELLILTGYVLWKKRNVMHYFAALLATVVLVAGLFVLDVGEVRYAIYRETGIMIGEQAPPADTPSLEDPDEDEVLHQQAIAQSQRSDYMRSELFKKSLEQVKANPLFGTGDLLYTYDVWGEIYEAPAHNFILATLNCYGIIGMLIIVAMVCIALWEMGVLDLKNKKKWEILFLCVLVLGVYFGVGLVQATVYDFSIMPVAFVILGAFAMFLEEGKTEKTQENDPV